MRFRITRQADADIDLIWNYIGQDNPAAADSVESRLHAAMHMLVQHPGMGHSRPDADPTYRFWRVHSYVIVYRLEAETLIVLRVVHGSRDLRKILRRS